MSILLAEPSRAPVAFSSNDEDRRFELVDGVEVELLPMSADAVAVASRFNVALTVFGTNNDVGESYVGMKIKLPPPRNNNRIPDLIFVPYTRWAKGKPIPEVDAWDILPSLCVEIVSPSDNSDEVFAKMEEYLQAGIDRVWIVRPRRQIIEIHDGSSTALKLRRGDTLEGGDILPGFRLPLNELFPTPTAIPTNN